MSQVQNSLSFVGSQVSIGSRVSTRQKATTFQLLILYTIIFVDAAQIYYVFPFLPQMVEKYDKGAFEIGMLMAVTAFAEGMAAPWLGTLADKVGRRPVFMVSCFGCCGCTLWLAYVTSYKYMVMARAIGGICGSTAAVAMAYIADVTDPSERPKYLNFAMVATFCGVSFGPALGGFLNTAYGTRIALYVPTAIAGLNGLTVMFFLPESRQIAGERQSCKQTAVQALIPCGKLPLQAWLAFVVVAFGGIGTTGFESLGVVFSQYAFFEGDIDKATVFWSFQMSAVGMAGLFAGLVLYPLYFSFFNRKMETMKCLKTTTLIGFTFMAGAFALMAFAPNQWFFFVGGLVYTVGDSLSLPSAQSILTMLVDEKDFGKLFGCATLFDRLSRSVAPFLVTWLFELGGDDAYGFNFMHSLSWILNIGLRLIAGVIVLFLTVRKPSPEDKIEGEQAFVSETGKDALIAADQQAIVEP